MKSQFLYGTTHTFITNTSYNQHIAAHKQFIEMHCCSKENKNNKEDKNKESTRSSSQPVTTAKSFHVNKQWS